jgi:hypothetical protein
VSTAAPCLTARTVHDFTARPSALCTPAQVSHPTWVLVTPRSSAEVDEQLSGINLGLPRLPR